MSYDHWKTTEQPATVENSSTLVLAARGKAAEGRTAMEAWWMTLTKPQRVQLWDYTAELKVIADVADAMRAEAAPAASGTDIAALVTLAAFVLLSLTSIRSKSNRYEAALRRIVHDAPLIDAGKMHEIARRALLS